MELDEDDEDDEFNYCNSYPKSEHFIRNYNDDDDIGYILEVDLHYP